MQTKVVAGEPVELLARALSQIRWKKSADESIHFTMRLAPQLGDPFLRALLRIEHELLGAEVNGEDVDVAGLRTPGQRRADAFAALVLRVADVLQQP
jgi:hypothetical protein